MKRFFMEEHQVVYLGIDPDLHDTALALVSRTGAVAVQVVSARDSTGPDAVQAMIEALRLGLPRWATELEVMVGEPVTAAVESQRIYARHQGGEADPDDLIRLAQVAGACALAVRALWSGCQVVMPYPALWKGQVPKQIHQSRTFKALEIEHGKVGSVHTGYCYPTKVPADLIGAGTLKKAQWKHAGDALGLALYARKISPSGR